MIDQARAERLAEHREALGQDGAVDAILQAVMVVAHVELAEAVLHHAGQAQHDLVELLVVAAGQRLDDRVGDAVAGRAERRLDRGPRLVEPLGGDDDLVGVGRGRRSGRARRHRRRCRHRHCRARHADPQPRCSQNMSPPNGA
jgi:hypothetical protein